MLKKIERTSRLYAWFVNEKTGKIFADLQPVWLNDKFERMPWGVKFQPEEPTFVAIFFGNGKTEFEPFPTQGEAEQAIRERFAA